MNAYTMAYCPTCSSLKVIGSTLSVHGADNMVLAEQMFKDGRSLSDIWAHFCSRCGGYIDEGDCGCGDCQPQIYYEEVA